MFVGWDNINKQMKEDFGIMTGMGYDVVSFLSWSKCILNVKIDIARSKKFKL